MKINSNIQALNAYRNLNQNQNEVSKNLEKLSSGLRINRASDDAAGLAISEKMRSQIRGLDQAERNSMDGISLIQTSEGAMQEIHSMLQRMRELSVQSANDSNMEYDREQIQKEIEELTKEIDSISKKTEFNTKKLLNGSSSAAFTEMNEGENGANLASVPISKDGEVDEGDYKLNVNGDDLTLSRDGGEVDTEKVANIKEGKVELGNFEFDFDSDPENGDSQFKVTNNSLAFQIGPNAGQQVMVDIPQLDSKRLGIDEINALTSEGASEAITQFDDAVNQVSDARAKLGAVQNRLEHTVTNLQVTHENLSSAESRIRDADMAEEMTEFTKNNIINQSATAMLAQANQMPQGVLQLLQ